MKLLKEIALTDIIEKENGIFSLLKQLENRKRMSYLFHFFSIGFYLFLLFSRKPHTRSSFLLQSFIYVLVMLISYLNAAIFYLFWKKESYYLEKENFDYMRATKIQEEMRDYLLADEKVIIGKKYIFSLKRNGLAVIPKEDILEVNLRILSKADVYLETRGGQSRFPIHADILASLYEAKSLAVLKRKFDSEEEKDLYKKKHGLGQGQWEFLKHLILTKE